MNFHSQSDGTLKQVRMLIECGNEFEYGIAIMAMAVMRGFAQDAVKTLESFKQQSNIVKLDGQKLDPTKI